MSLLDQIRRLFRRKQDDETFFSIVMLLRSPFVMSRETLEVAASKAFGVPYDGSHDMYFVVQDPALTVVKAGGLVIKVMEAAQPYLGDPCEVAQGFSNKRLANAWVEHRTWLALDLLNDDVPEKKAYSALAALAAQLLDVRCAGVYFPKENQFTIQGDGSAAEHLRRLMS